MTKCRRLLTGTESELGYNQDYEAISPLDIRYTNRPGLVLVDKHSVVDSAGEFADVEAADLNGDWWSEKIKAFV